MDFEKFKTNFNFVTNILILLFIVTGSFVWADSNGVWQLAQDIRSGTFGSDEGGGDYRFPDNLTVEDKFDSEIICLRNESSGNSQCIYSWDAVADSSQTCDNNKSVVGINSTGGIICDYAEAVYS